MLAQILNRPWQVSRKQADAVFQTELSSRRVFIRGIGLVGLGVALASCGVIDLATLTPTIVGYIQNTASALVTALAAMSLLGSSLPANWPVTLGQISQWVADIKSIADSLSTAPLVSTAGGKISNLIHDFNAIVEAIIANPIVAAAVSATGFGWALSAAAVLLPIIEQAVNLLINIATPPAPVPVPPAAAAHRMMTARRTAPMTPEVANEVLLAIAAGKH